SADFHLPASGNGSPPSFNLHRVDDRLPVRSPLRGWEDKLRRGIMRVHQYQQRIPDDPPPRFIQRWNGIPAEEKTEAAGERGLPLRLAHFRAIRAKPGQVLERGVPNVRAPEEISPVKHRLLLPKAAHLNGKIQNLPPHAFQAPVDPRQLIVLTVGVV